MVDGTKLIALGAAAASLLAAPALVRSAPQPQRPPAAQAVVEMHVGIRGVVYMGQPLKELLEKAPGAKVTRNEAAPHTVQVLNPAAGITCLAVGTSEDALKIVSVRFEFDRVYDRLVPRGYHSDKGIGPGSTVNDLVAAHGKPSQIFRGRATDGGQALKDDDGSSYEKYQYTSADGEFSTYFVVNGSAVKAMVVNEKDPLRGHINTPRPGK